MLGTDRTRSFQKNLILFPFRSSVLIFQPQKIYHIGTTQISFWAIIWQVLRAETVTNYTACHNMDAFSLIVRAPVMNSDIPVYTMKFPPTIFIKFRTARSRTFFARPNKCARVVWFAFPKWWTPISVLHVLI